MNRLDSGTAKALQRISAAANIAPGLQEGQGFSHSVNGKGAPTNGYMVSLLKHQVEEVLPGTTRPNAEQLASYAEKNMKHLTKKDHYLGGWARGDGSYVLDVSRNVHDEEEAHHIARRNNQDAVWDFKAAAADPNYGGTDTHQFTREQEQHIKRYHDNIVHSYHKVTDLDRKAGTLWYEEEGHKIADWARRHGVEHDTALQAFAAMSPGQDWDQIHAVMSAIHKHGPLVTSAQAGHAVQAGYGRDNFMKAHRVLNGETLDDVMRTEAPKVHAFYHNLAHAADDKDNVTVDGHAMNIADNDFTRSGITSAKRVTPLMYRMAEEAYKRAAGTLGVEIPHHVQAATWIGYRRLDPRAAAVRADPSEDNERHAIQNEHEPEPDLSKLSDIPF